MSDHDQTGYGKPPKASQFKPGQSGNPRGRPKGVRNLKTEIREVMKSKMTVTQNGKRTRISTRRALLLRLTEKALSGNIQATRVLLDLIRNDDEDEVAAVAQSLSPDDASILERFAAKIRQQDQAQDKTEELGDE